MTYRFVGRVTLEELREMQDEASEANDFLGYHLLNLVILHRLHLDKSESFARATADFERARRTLN